MCFPISLASTDVPFQGSSFIDQNAIADLFWVLDQDSLGLIGLFSERTKDGDVQ